MLMPLDNHFFCCGREKNAAKLLYNMFYYNWQTIIVPMKFKLSGNLPLKLFKNRLIFLFMKRGKLILIEVKYINCKTLIVCIAIISNMYSSGSLAPF